MKGKRGGGRQRVDPATTVIPLVVIRVLCTFVGTGVLYYVLNLIPAVRRYNLKDRAELTV